MNKDDYEKLVECMAQSLFEEDFGDKEIKPLIGTPWYQQYMVIAKKTLKELSEKFPRLAWIEEDQSPPKDYILGTEYCSPKSYKDDYKRRGFMRVTQLNKMCINKPKFEIAPPMKKGGKITNE